MRILLILSEFPPHFGGMQTHAIYLSNYLSRQGHTIEVLTNQSVDAEVSRQAELYDARCDFTIHRLLSRIGYWNNIAIITRRAAGFKPDIIYASNVYYGIARKFLRIPVICRSVGNDLLRPWIAYPFRFGSRIVSHPKFESTVYEWVKRIDFPDWLDNIFRAQRTMLVYESLKLISCIFANSLFTAKILHQMGVKADKIKISTGGVDSQRFNKPDPDVSRIRRALRLPQVGFLILTACRLVPKKGIDFLLHAFRQIKSLIPEAQLIVIGEGKERTKCESLAVSLEISRSVLFAGYVPHGRIHHYYWGCDVFALASRTCYNARGGIKDIETMGRVLCEANASGIPIVASRSGGIPSVITHEANGLLFEENDLSGFIRQILRIRMDGALRLSLIGNGQRRAWEQFDWSVLLEDHEAIFEDLKIQLAKDS